MKSNKGYKFTAGPWAISNNGKPTFGFYYIRQDPENWNGHGYQAIGRNVSELHASTKGTPYGEMFKANAILIASAPDLIKALDRIINSSEIDEIKSIAIKAIELATDSESCQ